jgi:hypothetical protein
LWRSLSVPAMSPQSSASNMKPGSSTMFKVAFRWRAWLGARL